jgi:hypothetical protein
MNVTLTDAQRDAMTRLGDPESDPEGILIDTLNDLLALGLLHKRP